ncbi:MAG TPA: DNA polymerase III subunit gamma/tau [Sphingomonadaceae bacterium]|nr:DNA polymerase III subunit gamma/tau [Sphingomonadaceae bacterium]
MSTDSEEPALFGDAPPLPAAAVATPYRVLARKYRPQSFGALIGQDAMVRTLGNAIARDRLAHAFLLTGVRGVGKTSTARLIAKALNCIGPDGQSGPTIDPCGACEPCRAIAEGRHIDVVEMDAASHTGVDDIREIVEAVRYAAVSARYKVYIIDEVHMLSRNAFNALLKTLEEPPGHVKFLFATTEIGKVPVTVLSRCQRFDLRRIPADTLAAHFAEVSRLEEVEAEPEALALIARAAEGSARDGLSLLDQAIAHGQATDGRTRVEADAVRDMLGLADRGMVRRLLGLLLAGDAPGALAAVREQHDLGVEPAALLRDLLAAVHGITRAKAGGSADPAQSAEEQSAYADWASRLGHASLHRLWQLLLKGLGEVNAAPVPLEAAEMALLRIIHAGSMPDPGDVLARLEGGGAVSARPAAAAPAPDGPAAMPSTLADLHDRLAAANHHRAALLVHDHGRLFRLAPPDVVFALHPRMTDEALRNLTAALKDATGGAWRVATEEGEGAPTLREQEQAAEAGERYAVLASPIVRAALEAFPDAELLSYSAPLQAEA